MPYAAQVHSYFAAAVEWMPGVFGVDLTQQGQFQLVRFCGQVRRIEGGAGYTSQRALCGQRQWVLGVYPLPPVLYRLIPDFFLSQSSSIFSRPISEYSRSELAAGSTGAGPRVVSNMPAA